MRETMSVFLKDLGVPDGTVGFEMLGEALEKSMGFINPLTKEDILEHREALFDPENVISVSDATHKAIHYGDESALKPTYEERRPGDTCPWRK